VSLFFCSTIIPTVGRPSLTRAVISILSQSFRKDDFEIIVVNDSGMPLPVMDWQISSRVRVINTNRWERSIARNAGAAIAKGRYLHFLDDDDWLFPDAFDHFWELSQKKEASWFYGKSQLVGRDGRELIQLHHGIEGNCFLQAMAGEWIPLQSSLIDAKLFHRLGGFSPQIVGPEDIDLFRRVCLYGDIAETPHLIAKIERGEVGSTTNYDQHPEISRMARENILNETQSFARMKERVHSGYWLGKLVRIYFTSAVWNLQRKRIAFGASRLIQGTAGMLLAPSRVFSKGFWRAVMSPYQSPTFERGLKTFETNFVH
jgi:glycosyltransferase involved in cell wall biosynthesis